MPVTAATLGANGRSVTLKFADMRPAMQTKIEYDLKAADGSAAQGGGVHDDPRVEIAAQGCWSRSAAAMCRSRYQMFIVSPAAPNHPASSTSR